MSAFLKNAAAAVNSGATQPAQPAPAPTLEVVDFPLVRIAADTAAQTRVMLDTAKVSEYAALMQEPELLADFPPILLVQDADGTIRISRGYTRVAAARVAGLTTFRAIVRQGNTRDAIVWALGDNARHGNPRTQADLMHELDMVLCDPELSKWSDREIAKRVHCTHRTVGLRRKFWEEKNQAPDTGERVRTDKHGNVTTINVAGIGAANAARAGKSKVLDATGTYSVIQRTLAQQEPGVEVRFAWLRAHEGPEAFSSYLPVGYTFDDHTFASQWQRAYDELEKRQPKVKAQPAPQPGAQPMSQPAPAGGIAGKFVAPEEPAPVQWDSKAYDHLGNLTVYLGEVRDILPSLSKLLAGRFDYKEYRNQTCDLLTLVGDLLAAMEAERGFDDADDDDAGED